MDMSGYAIFGTADGLHVRGNGILEAIDTSVLEFRTYSPLLKVLSVFDIEKDFVIFVRSIRNTGGDLHNIIGLLAPCLDAYGRNGFFGYCFSLKMDDFHKKDNEGKIQKALLDAHDKITKLNKKSIEENGVFKPNNNSAMSTGAVAAFQATAKYEAYYDVRNIDKDSVEIIDYIKKAFWEQGLTHTLFVFSKETNISESLDEKFSIIENVMDDTEEYLNPVKQETEKLQSASDNEYIRTPKTRLDAAVARKRAGEGNNRYGERIASLEVRVGAMEDKLNRIYDLLNKMEQTKKKRKFF